MNESITKILSGAVVGSLMAVSLSTTAQTTIEVETDINKAREELIITRTETIEVETKLTLRDIDSQIAATNLDLAFMDERIAEFITLRAEIETKRTELETLRVEMVVELPTR